jgi:hypothetical protein
MPFSSSDEDNPYAPPRAPLGSPRRSTPEGLAAIVISFLVSSTLGGASIFSYWRSRGLWELGIVRALGMAIIMAGVHFVGYRIYARQQGRPS